MVETVGRNTELLQAAWRNIVVKMLLLARLLTVWRRCGPFGHRSVVNLALKLLCTVRAAKSKKDGLAPEVTRPSSILLALMCVSLMIRLLLARVR